MSITQSRIAEILYSLATHDDADDIILSLAEYDEAATDRIDVDYSGDRFALTDGTVIEYVHGKFGGWKVAGTTQSRKAEILYSLNAINDADGADTWRYIFSLAEYDDATTDRIDPGYRSDRFALTDGTMIEYVPGKFGGWKVADASRVAEWLDEADERENKEAAELAYAEAEDIEAAAITLERDQVRGTEYESRYADANNHGLRYVMQLLALAVCGDEDAIRELADLDADAQG